MYVRTLDFQIAIAIALFALLCLFVLLLIDGSRIAQLQTRVKAVESQLVAPTQVLPEPCPE